MKTWLAALRNLVWVGALSGLVYALICLAVWVGQRNLLFHPDANPLKAAPAGAKTLILQTADGERLVSWWLEPPDRQAPVLLYLHGNGANLDARAGRLAALQQDGAGVLALSWRGYGGSTGSPSEAGWAQDADTGYDTLIRLGIEPERIVLFGESLGSAQAVMLAARADVAGLVLDSSFDSALALAKGHYPWLPLHWLMRDPHRADRVAPAVKVPVLQLHCQDDPVSPLHHAQALQRRLGGGSELHLLPQTCHVPGYAAWRGVVQRFLSQRRANQ